MARKAEPNSSNSIDLVVRGGTLVDGTYPLRRPGDLG